MAANTDLHSIRVRIMASKRIAFGIYEYRDAENRSRTVVSPQDENVRILAFMLVSCRKGSSGVNSLSM
jgi:hypothetical protein